MSDANSRTANPAYTADELQYQLDLTKAKVIFAHTGSIANAEQAARDCHIPPSHIAHMDSPAGHNTPYPTIEHLVSEGLKKHPLFEERRLKPGEGKTKVALMSFSSGTTGRPKAVAIPHYAVLANVIQMAHYGKTTDDVTDRYKPGQVVVAGMPMRNPQFI